MSNIEFILKNVSYESKQDTLTRMMKSHICRIKSMYFMIMIDLPKNLDKSLVIETYLIDLSSYYHSHGFQRTLIHEGRKTNVTIRPIPFKYFK